MLTKILQLVIKVGPINSEMQVQCATMNRTLSRKRKRKPEMKQLAKNLRLHVNLP